MYCGKTVHSCVVLTAGTLWADAVDQSSETDVKSRLHSAWRHRASVTGRRRILQSTACLHRARRRTTTSTTTTVIDNAGHTHHTGPHTQAARYRRYRQTCIIPQESLCNI